MKNIKKLHVSIDFSTKMLIISLASGGGGIRPRTPYKCILPKFSKFFPKFRENFVKILKNFKISNFPAKFSKDYKCFIDF